MLSTNWCWREPIEIRDIVIMQLGKQPARARKLDHRIDRSGALPVDQRDGVACTRHHVPRRKIAMTDHAPPATEIMQEPQFLTGVERSSRLVQLAQQSSDLTYRLVAPGVWVDELPLMLIACAAIRKGIGQGTEPGRRPVHNHVSSADQDTAARSRTPRRQCRRRSNAW